MPSFLAAALGLAAALAPFLTSAQDHAPRAEKNDLKKIHITADMLTSNSAEKFAEFTGNVRATQEDTVITANKLKIFYKKGLQSKESSAAGEESIREIVATGNVKINFEDKVAYSEEAVYTTENRILVLTGDNSKIISGKDTISGAKITLYRDDGRIKVESSPQNRVEAVFYSMEKGMK